MAIAKCVFCGLEQEDYMGTYLLKNDGTTPYYCSSKCYKSHLKLGRDKRNVRWTEAHKLIKEKHKNAAKEQKDSGIDAKKVKKSGSKK